VIDVNHRAVLDVAVVMIVIASVSPRILPLATRVAHAEPDVAEDVCVRRMGAVVESKPTFAAASE
jgi:hypothetical protein